MQNKLNGIAKWFSENNQKTKNDPKRLNLLTFMGAILLNVDTEISFKNKELNIKYEPNTYEFTKEELDKLRLLNISYGYIKNIDNGTPFLHMFYELSKDFTINTENLHKYFDDNFIKVFNDHKNYDNCKILNINDKTFFIFIDEDLTKEDIDYLASINDPDQDIYNVYGKDENGLDVW